MTKSVIFLTILFVVIPCKAQDKEYAHRIIEVMASPEFKGRGYVHNGHGKAARFVAKEFSYIGLEGLFNKQYYQQFPITINTFPSKMELTIDGISIEPGKDFLVHPASPSCKGSFDVYYIKKSQLTSTDALNTVIRESQGKFVMIDARAGSVPGKESLKIAGELVDILSYSDRVPSSGTVIITDDKLTWSISKQRGIKPVITVKSDSLRSTPSGISVNIKSSLSDYQTRNVAGFIPGAVCPDSFIVIIAHYDHLGKMGKEVYFPGANDNASGVAMLLSLARYFKQNPHRYSMVFVAMAAEESGLDGSRFFTEHPPIDLHRIVFLLNFDLAGTGDDGIQVVNGTEYKDKFGKLVDLNSASDYLKDVRIRGPACNSDHCNFHERGVPCFYIYTLGGSAYYHDIHDKPSALSLSHFPGYFKLMVEFLQRINHVNE